MLVLPFLLLFTATVATTPDYSSQWFFVCIDPAEECRVWPVQYKTLVTITKKHHLRTLTLRQNCTVLTPSEFNQMKTAIDTNNTNSINDCKSVQMKFDDFYSVLDKRIGSPRLRRQVSYKPKGKYRGQTQSQYLAIDRGNGKDDGKAEAHSDSDSSRASVSGSSGMGQAQSQTVYDPSCDECNSHGQDGDFLRHRPSSGDERNFNDNQKRIGPDGNPLSPLDKDGSRTYTDANRPQNYPFGGTSNQGGPNPTNLDRFAPQGNNYNANRIGLDGKPMSPSGIDGSRTYTDANRPQNYAFGGTNNQGGPNPTSNGSQGNIPGVNTSGSHGNYRPNQGGTKYDPDHPYPLTNGAYMPDQKNPKGIDISNFYPYGAGNNGNRGSGFPERGIGSPDQTGSINVPIPGDRNSVNGEIPTRIPNGDVGFLYDPRTKATGNKNNQWGANVSPLQPSILNKWPFYSGSIPAANGNTVVCCVISPNGNTQYLGPYGTGTSEVSGGTRPGDINYAPGTVGTGQYGPGTGGLQIPGGQYGPGAGSGQTPGGQYGPGTGSGQTPGGQYGPGTGSGQTPGGQYGPGTGSGQTPGGQYGPGTGSGQTPGGQYGPGTGNGPTPGGQYGPGTGSGQTPGGQYGPGTGNGPTPGGQYGPGAGSGQTPGGQYGPGTGSGQTPGGQYGPGTGNGPTPGGQYGPGAGSGQTPGGQYGPGTGSGQIPGGQYGPGTGNGPTPGGQYGPGAGSGQTPGGQYAPGIGRGPTPGGQYGTGSGQTPGGQYGPGTGIGQTPGGQYGTGSGQTPGGQYGPGTGIGQTPGGQYEPGTGIGQTPGGLYGPGTSSAQTPGGQYVPGTGSGYPPGTIQVPVGHYGPSTGSGQYGPGTVSGQYGPGPGSGQTPGGPYRPEIGSGKPGGLYGPGSNTGEYGPDTSSGQMPGGLYAPGQYGPGTGSGQYGPSSGIGQKPEGQYGVGQKPGDQYGPGSVGGQPLGNQYGPGAGIGQTSGGQYGPGTGSGEAPRGQFGPGTGSGQYNPGTGSGQYGPGSGSQIPGGPYGSGLGSGQTRPGTGSGQYEPGTGSGQIPGGRYEPGTNGGPTVGGQYGPGTGSTQTPGGQYGPGAGTGPTPGGQYGPGVGSGQTTGGHYLPGTGTGQYVPGYDGGIPQNVLDPNSISEKYDSAAEASIAQNVNGTIASASSKGGNDKGHAQTNVQGTYTGSGSFSAQADITDENKGAHSEVTGDKKGSKSSAQGKGQNNLSQASVQLGSETGSLQTAAESKGSMHSSNSQVQGSVKGGMADAQARGPGSTSSQAQIGFTPYKDGDKSHESLPSPFVGKGLASAQSSERSGQSQSNLQGTFKYGISYNGAAQAGASIDKDAVFENRAPFKQIDVFDENNKNINVNTDNPSEITTSLIEANTEASDPESTFSHKHSEHHKLEGSLDTPASVSTPAGSKRSFHANDGSNVDYEYTTGKEDNRADDYYPDGTYGPDGSDNPEIEQSEYSNYDENPSDPTHESLESSGKKNIEVKQTTRGNTQHIVLGSLHGQNAVITQKNSDRPDENKIYQPGEKVPGTGGYTIPIGFTGSVKSVASKDKTYVVGNKHSPSQAQTVTLTPGTGKIKYTYPAAYGRNIDSKYLKSLYDTKRDDSNKYMSVSKSVTRDLDSENNIRKQYSHTYYTKSSSCGYFTFTCTMVSGPDGRKKVCRPKIPTNPDGTPMKC